MDKKFVLLLKERNTLQVGVIQIKDYPKDTPSENDLLAVHGIAHFRVRDIHANLVRRECITVYDGLYRVIKVIEGYGNTLLAGLPAHILSLHPESSGYSVVLRKERELCDDDIDFIIDPEVTLSLC